MDTDDHEEHAEEEQGLAVLDGAGSNAKVSNVKADEETEKEGEEAERAEEVAGAGDVSGEEDDSDEVKKAFDASVDAEFGLAVPAGTVFDYNFSDFVILFGDEDRDETIKFSVEIEVVDDFFAIGLETTVDVVYWYASENSSERVHDAGGKDLRQGRVVSFFFPAGDKIVAGGNFFKKGGDFLGIILEISIEGKDNVSFGLIKSGLEGDGFAEVAS